MPTAVWWASLVTQPAPLANPVTVRIGGIQAEVQWAGRSGAGLGP